MPGLVRSAVDRPQQLVRGDRDIDVARDEDRAPDLADCLVAVAVYDLAGQRDRLATNDQPHPRCNRRRLERQAAHVCGCRGPVVQPAAIDERATQEIGLRAFGILRDRQHEPACQQRPGGDRGSTELQTLEAPAGGRRDGNAVHPHRAVAGVPDIHFDL
ncbi:MAG: hypothetical protein DMD48_15400 [Gemmatimonadetes bacterium]|nr:MAG: hypothetical protein DMD48_15400 [Gemmatimonadota bacterium]